MVMDWYYRLLLEDCVSSWAQYTVQLPKILDRDEIQLSLKSMDIPTMVYYKKPMHLQEAFKGSRSAIADCPVAEKLCKSVLSLPMHPYLSKEEIINISNHLINLS